MRDQRSYEPSSSASVYIWARLLAICAVRWTSSIAEIIGLPDGELERLREPARAVLLAYEGPRVDWDDEVVAGHEMAERLAALAGQQLVRHLEAAVKWRDERDLETHRHWAWITVLDDYILEPRHEDHTVVPIPDDVLDDVIRSLERAGLAERAEPRPAPDDWFHTAAKRRTFRYDPASELVELRVIRQGDVVLAALARGLSWRELDDLKEWGRHELGPMMARSL